MKKSQKPSIHISLVIFLMSLLFTFVIWDHYFDSDHPIDRMVVSNLVLLMGILFSVFAGFATWILESGRSHLEEEIHQQTYEVLQKEREEIALYQSSKAIFSTMKLDKLLDIVMDLVQKVLRADEGSLMLLDGENKLYIAASRGMDAEVAKSVHISIGERVAGKAAQDKRDYLLVGGLEKYSKFQGIKENRKITSSIVCPLLYHNQALGVLNLNRTTTLDHFTPADLRNASTFASQVAQAVQNAKLYQTLEGKIVELKESNERLKETQTQLIESDKLASIGRLVAGVAHELNNPLTAVLGYTNLILNDELKGKIRDRSKMCGQLTIVTREAARCHKIVQDLLTFAHRGEPKRDVVNPSDLIDDVLNVLSFEFKKNNINIIKKYPNPCPLIQADAQQIEQVFLNILVNARDALQNTSEPRQMEVTVTAVGDILRIVFSDNGPGISKEHLHKLFDPFFTTKEVGKGTGLGLSLAYGVIQRHGGRINVRSERGKGAAFIIELPVTSMKESVTSKPNKKVVAENLGSPREILLVEDQESVLGFMEEILAPGGHTIEKASDGEAALSKIQEKHFDLIICDYHLPKMDGRTLYEKVNAENKALAEHFFFITGCVVDNGMTTFFEENQLPRLVKPFTAEDLLAAISPRLKP